MLSADIIYVGCGDTKFMLKIWKEKRIDKILREAFKDGKVLAGMSAGSYCWFGYNYDAIEGIGIIDAINCVHYNQKDDSAKNKFYKLIKKTNKIGIAIDDCAAIVCIDDKYKVIRNKPNCNAYKIYYNNGQFIKEKY